MIYNANPEKGKQYIREALNCDPDNITYQKAWRNLQKLEKLKKEGTDAFTSGQYKEAVERFSECLELDPLNNSYNSTILYNKACAYLKQGMIKEALKDLDQCLKINDEYVKALLKRSELYLQQKNFEEAVRDLEKIKSVDPSTQGLRQKLQEAKLELKKSLRKDYYKILDIQPSATEEEIRKAYRRQALLWHPDKHSNGEEEAKVKADTMFKDIGEAYSVLSDQQKKARYDQGADIEELENPGAGHGFHGDPSEMFQQFFGGGGHSHGQGGQSFSFRYA